MNPEFLTLSDVLEMHADEIARSGGMPGVRDQGLLESALAQPQASVFGEYLHADLFSMAAAYLFHIVGNHPFLDGNKRAGLLAALVFLEINGWAMPDDAPELYDLTLAAAESRLDKSTLADALRKLAVPGAF
jgi:death-on-curing protein